jgi:nicotinamide phosphoribosyltransferase
MNNFLLTADSYKYSHFLQFPPKTSFISSYIESRGGRWNRVVFFGLQAFLKEYLSRPVTQDDVEEARAVIEAHGEPFNYEGWSRIVEKCGGLLPVQIEAVPEGTLVPTSNVLVQIVNTDPEFPWLPGFLETALLRSVWYPTTVATQSFMIKKVILDNLRRTADDPEAEISFKLHDFGFRGVSSLESGSLGGLAHLVNFMGTDTVGALVYARRYYGEPMAGFSIPAAEHSTITSWGGPEREVDAFRNMVETFGGEGKLYAVVSDSYNIWEAVEKWYSLKDEVVARGGTLVIRPDSGNPVAVVSGLIDALMNRFGHEVNTKGFRVLPPYLRVIQGDGVNERSIKDILQELEFRRVSGSNVAFGMGGALLQHLDRDALRFAMKASAIYTDGEGWRDVYKCPVGDAEKASKRGRLALLQTTSGKYVTMRADDLPYRELRKNVLRPVYKDGVLLADQTLAEVRERAREALK